jgi:hypothetical protein
MRKVFTAALNLLWMGGVLLAADSNMKNANRAAAEFRSRGGQATFNDQKQLVTLDLHRTTIGDDELKLLDSLSTLQTLDLSYTRVRAHRVQNSQPPGGLGLRDRSGCDNESATNSQVRMDLRE